jgi:3-hydroxyacyl-CoA dehydrogenase
MSTVSAAVPPFVVRKAAVLGAGVMGAQIAAHLANANVEAVLFELAAKEGDPNGNVLKAIDNLKRLEPSPLATAARAGAIRPANYDQHLDLLKECDLVIEAISERMDWKSDLYKKVAPHLSDNAIFASNTSGLSINTLAQAFPEGQRHRFCGVHFFNPLEKFLVTTLGKGVIRAKDTPNFIANRVGVFSMLATIYHAERLNIGFDTVDALTGSLIGRPKSATFRTADVVGLDTFAHVVNTMKDTLPNDPWHPYYAVPAWLKTLIDQGALGQKTRRGVYQKVGNDIQVLDLKEQKYRLSDGKADDGVVEILKNKNVAERFVQLHASSHPQAQFLWSIFRDSFHYCATHLGDIANNARDLDFAIRWGFGWDVGPFEIWQSAGWPQVAKWVAEDVAAGKAMASVPLPAWATDASRAGVHTPQGSFSPPANSYQSRPLLPVYKRQPFPDKLLGEDRQYGTTIFETDGVRCWHTGDDIAIVSFKSRMHAIGDDVLEGVQQAIEAAENNYMGLVVWQTEPPFSIGANLKKSPPGNTGNKPQSRPSGLSKMFRSLKKDVESLALKAARQMGVADQLMAGKLAEVEKLVEEFQVTTMALKYSMIPTVAAVDGFAFGGGCEFVMHCDRAVASLESYIGLVEVGVGLLPAGGGCKEFAIRAAMDAKGGDQSPFIQKYFRSVAMADVGRSAEHARDIGYLRPTDKVVMNRFELLEIAKAEVRALAAGGYRPPLRQNAIPAAGRSQIATIRSVLENMLAGAQISEHDHLIGQKVATVMCGGDIEAGSLVDEQWYLDLERKHFMELLATEKTQARIEYMLKNGRPLRN